MWKPSLALWCCLLSAAALAQNAPTLVNPGFEEPAAPPAGKQRPESVYPAKGWSGWLANGATSGIVRQGAEPHSGQYALEMRVLGDDPAKYNIHVQQSLPALPGRNVRVTFFARRRGNVNGWAGVYFYDAAGKRVPGEAGVSIRHGDEYRRFEMETATPATAARMDLMFRVLTRNQPAPDAVIFVDDVEISLDASGVLENEKIVARLDPVWGGRVRSLALKTAKGPRETLVWLGPQAGGGAQTLMPAQKSEFLHDQPYKIEMVEPLRVARMSLDVNFADPARARFNGLRVEKTLSLPPGQARLDVRLRLTNTTDRAMEIPMRERQCLPPRPAVWTWPFNDWLKALDRSKDLFASQARTALGRGWMAVLSADGLGMAVTLDPAVALEAYSYFSGDVDTLEWYYAPVKLQPKATWETSYSILLFEGRGMVFGANDGAVFTAELAGETVETVWMHGAAPEKARVAVDGKAAPQPRQEAGALAFAVKADLARTVSASVSDGAVAGVIGGKGEGRVEWVKLASAPPPPPRADLPPFFSQVFPFMGHADFLYYPEGSGGGDVYADYMARLPRDLRYAGFNGIISGRITQRESAPKLVDKDGVNRYARDAKRYGLFLSDFTHYLGKSGEETQRRFWSLLERRKAGDKDLAEFPFPKAFLKMCDDGLVPFMAISDEPPASQISEMGKVIATLKELRHDIVYFPIINMNLFDFAPYAPVYFGDFYPIKSAPFGGRNPWSMGPVVRKAAESAKATPVWLVAQAFGYPAFDMYGATPEAQAAAGSGQYELPTAGEMRLMLHLAVANGAKGIDIYGMGRLAWRSKYWYFHTVYDNAGATTPAYDAACEAARVLTAAGPLLLQTDPAELGDAVRVTSDDAAFGKFYAGPALAAYALKPRQGAGLFACVVNMDPEKERKGQAAFESKPASVLDLSTMRDLGATASDAVALPPGGMVLYYLGPAEEAKGLWQRARAGYARNALDILRIDLDRAASNGLKPAKAEDAFGAARQALDKGQGEEAWRLALSARQEFDAAARGTELAECVAALAAARPRLSAAATSFREHFPRFVPLSVYASTANFKRFNNTEDPAAQALVDAVAQDFVDYWRLEREIWEGRCAAAAPAVRALAAKVERDTDAVKAFLAGPAKR